MAPTVATTPVAEGTPDPADPLHAFIQQWPRVETELTMRQVDDHKVWGSSNMNAAEIWGVAWESDTTLTFCGHAPKQRVTRFRAVLAGNTAKVVRIGTDCPPDGARWSTFD